MNTRLRNLKALDLVAFLVAVFVTGGAAFSAYGGNKNATHLHVEVSKGAFLYDLSRDVRLEFDGPIGTTVVVISDGNAKVESSPCREQICVNSGILKEGGDWTACLPNRVFLEVTGNEGNGIDAVSF